jgi:hypothetical protein
LVAAVVAGSTSEAVAAGRAEAVADGAVDVAAAEDAEATMNPTRT